MHFSCQIHLPHRHRHVERLASGAEFNAFEKTTFHGGGEKRYIGYLGPGERRRGPRGPGGLEHGKPETGARAENC